MNLKKGELTSSGNFKLVKKIDSLDELWGLIDSETPSVFARHRMYPTAFFFSWHFRQVKSWIDKGWFWKAERVQANKR